MAQSTMHNLPSQVQTRRSIRFSQPKINRTNSNGGPAANDGPSSSRQRDPPVVADQSERLQE
jgi:hypothetical protein